MSIRTTGLAIVAVTVFIAFVSAGQLQPAAPGRLNATDIDRMIKELSNWGRWGKDDQLGPINLITPAKRKQAVALVREGTSVSLSFNPPTEKAVDNPTPFELTMSPVRGAVVIDSWRGSHHGFTFTHLDALCHWLYQGRMYNGFEQTEITPQGCGKLGIERLKDGVLTRGVLIDVPRLKGVPYLEPGTPIYREDIEAWERRARVKISPGDAVLIRTGRWGRRAALGPFSIQGTSAGVHVSAAPLFKARDVALVASDVGLDVSPTGVDGVGNPVHTVLMVAMGVAIIDNADLERLAETAARLNRWEFLFQAAPIPVTGATGALINAVATF